MSYTVKLYYGWEENVNGEVSHTFRAVDPLRKVSSEDINEIEKKLAEDLGLNVLDHAFDWNHMEISIPDSVVARIKSDGIKEHYTRQHRYPILCADYAKRKPAGEPIDKKKWFTAVWNNGNDSINDLLRRFLDEHGIEYLNHHGNVWFLYQGHWRDCEAVPDSPFVHFYMNEYIDN